MAFGDKTFADAGGAVSDLFGGVGSLFSSSASVGSLQLKAKGDLAEAGQYDLAAKLAAQNEEFTKQSTAIQEAQQQRNTTMQIGGQEASVAGAGFAESGSALDILADSARQGALAKATLGQQGLITEAGYKEQADSYTMMAKTARDTAAGEEDIANQTGIAGMFSSVGNFAGAALKGAAAIATIAV